MAKSNDKTHQTNGQQLSYSWLVCTNLKEVINSSPTELHCNYGQNGPMINRF